MSNRSDRASGISAVCHDCGERPATDHRYGREVCFECWERDTEPIRAAHEADLAAGVEFSGGESDWDELTVRGADLGRARPPRWAWQDRIVIGYLNLLLGNEGVGKGVLVVRLIARLTRGELPGDLRGEPVAVAVVGDEDSFDDVWTPRLHAAGADLSLVVQIERPDGGYIDLREDRERLAQAVARHRLRVVFFDQLLDNIGVGVDDWRQKPVRDALQPLRSLARELDVAALCNLHPNKRGSSFRALVAGAPTFNALSRSSLLLAQHPEDEDVRVLVRGKGNLSRTPAAVEFRIAEHRFDANGHEFKVPVASVPWTSELTVDALLEAEPKPAEHSKIADACDIIEALLPHDGGWHPAKSIFEACAEENVDERTVKRAKSRLRIEHRRERKPRPAVEWRWPPSEDTSGPRQQPFPTVPTANGSDPLRSTSEDTQDSQDSSNTTPHCVPTADADAELDRLRTKYPDLADEEGW